MTLFSHFPLRPGLRTPAFILGVLTLALSPPKASAYPGAPSSWGTWSFETNAGFAPLQISALTDPDGRLRTHFLDRHLDRNFTDAAGAHRVCPAVMQSFRVVPDGAVLSQFQALVTDYSSTTGHQLDASYASAFEPRRTALHTSLAPGGRLQCKGAYIRQLPSESFGYGTSILGIGALFPLGDRPVLPRNAGYSNTSADVLVLTSAPAASEGSAMENYGEISISRTSGSAVPYLIFSQTGADGVNALIYQPLTQGTPSNWTSNRVFTGASIAVTADRRDIYAALASHQGLSSPPTAPELRVFRIRTSGVITPPTTPGGSGSLGVESTTSTLVATAPLIDGTRYAPLLYPQILVGSTDEPRWLVWQDSVGGFLQDAPRLRIARRQAVTGGTAAENTRSIASGYYIPPAYSTGVTNAGGSGPSASLDRLNRLHLVSAKPGVPAITDPQAVYNREEADGSFTAITFSGACDGAPALAVGPGDYPYIVYAGRPAGDASSSSKLIVAWPPGLAAAYKGDFEDRDHDGRLALIERAQGTSDTTVESPAVIRTLLFPALSSGAPEERQFELTFSLAGAAARVAGQIEWTLADGNDTLRIRPAYSVKGGPFATDGFQVTEEFSITGRGRVVVVRDTVKVLNPSYPSQMYRLQVTREPGPP